MYNQTTGVPTFPSANMSMPMMTNMSMPMMGMAVQQIPLSPDPPQPAHKHVIAIDGPAGAGKTTQAKAIATSIGYNYLNTGMFYRVIAVSAATYPGIGINHLLNMLYPRLAIGWENPTKQFITIDSKMFEEEGLRSPTTALAASSLSREADVRVFVNNHIYEVAKNFDIVVEGRDTCTVLFPDADVKFYLTANPLIRTYRRIKQTGEEAYEKALHEIITRDNQDMTRAIAPLVPAPGAFVLDCSDLTIEGTTDVMLAHIPNTLKPPALATPVISVPAEEHNDSGLIFGSYEEDDSGIQQQ